VFFKVVSSAYQPDCREALRREVWPAISRSPSELIKAKNREQEADRPGLARCGTQGRLFHRFIVWAGRKRLRSATNQP